MSVEVKAARERSGYPPSLAVAENRRCQHFGALDGHFVAMGSLLLLLLETCYGSMYSECVMCVRWKYAS